MTNNTEELISQNIPGLRIRLYISSILLILSIIQLGGMGYLYMNMYKKDPGSFGLGNYLSIPFFLIILFNIIFILVLFQILRLHPFRSSELNKILTIWLGFVSLIGFLLDFAAISDIRKEHLTGLYDCSPEFILLSLFFFVHLVFYVLLARNLFIAILYLKKSQNKDIFLYSENNYIRLNLIGILSSMIGISITLILLFSKGTVIDLKRTIIPFCLLLSSPYFFYLTYWILRIKKEQRSKMLDEKQYYDFLKAGFSTLILTLPVITIYFLLNHYNILNHGSILWFPFYLFFTLLIFSTSALFYYKRN